MKKLSAKDFEDIKESLLFGYVSPSHLHRALLIFVFTALFFIGIASFAVFIPSTVIGWHGLSSFWQTAFITSYSFMIVQVLFILFVPGNTNTQHIILLVGFILSLCKFSLDIFILLAVIMMDTYVYDELRLFLFIIFLIGILLCIGFIIDGFRKRIKAKAAANVRNLSITHTFILLIVSVVTIIYFWSDLSMLDGEGTILTFVGIVLYYAFMASMVLPLQALYCYRKFPSYRLEENKETIELYEKEIEREMAEIEQVQNRTPLEISPVSASVLADAQMEEEALNEVLDEIVTDYYFAGNDEVVSVMTIGTVMVAEDATKIGLLCINRTVDTIRNIAFELSVTTDTNIAILHEVPIRLDEEYCEALPPNHALPFFVDLSMDMLDVMEEHDFETTISALQFEKKD